MGLASRPTRGPAGGAGRRGARPGAGETGRDRAARPPAGRASGASGQAGVQAAVDTGRDASVRSHRGRRGVHQGLMYWNSDRFCSCA